MTTTEINIHAFCSEIKLKIRRKHPLTITEAIKYVIEELEWETAIVKSIVYDGTIIENALMPMGPRTAAA